MLKKKATKKGGGKIAKTERQCLFARKKNWRAKGCKKPAVWRVLLGKGRFIDVCEDHVKGYRGLGLKIIKLEVLKLES